MFLRSDQGLDAGSGTAALSIGRAAPVFAPPGRLETWFRAVRDIDWVPDLGQRIGSPTWWRGAASCTALITAAWWITPGITPIPGAMPVALSGAAWDEARAQSIAPLAWGATTGRRMAASELVRPLAEAPERPFQQLTATLGSGDRFARALARAGVGGDEAEHVADLVGRAVPLDSLSAGTQLDLTLGRRPNKSVPRPLDGLVFRARFDLEVAVSRVGGALVVTPRPIAIDNTPLRIRGLVGQSLYRSARAAGAPAKAVEAYIRAIASRMPVARAAGSDNVFDLIVEQARAATGEVKLGKLLYAGLDRDGERVQLVRWERGDRESWFDPRGQGERRGVMAMPVDGRLTSGYGVRVHPILGTLRMHKGLDIAAPYGTPARAAMDGVVVFAGRRGGYGNFIQINHPGGLATGYGHLSAILVRPGARVSQGQQIGRVGSTGLSTGPHLHYELWRQGIAVNPRSVSYTQVEQLLGTELRAFRAHLASLLSAPVGAGVKGQ